MKILCIQLRQMGDVIMTTPAVRQLRAICPDAEIVFMTEPLGANVYRNNPHISRTWVVPRKQPIGVFLKLLWQVNRQKFDLVIDFFSNPKSAQIAFASRAKERIGFDFKGRRYAYTRAVSLPDSKEYAARSKTRLITHLGGNLEDDAGEFPVDPAAELYAGDFCRKYGLSDRTIAFCVVSRREYKLWEPENWAKLAKRLQEAGYRLFFVYGPGEKAMADAVYGVLEDPKNAVIDYEMPDLQQLRAIIGRCRAYVGNDGGSKHLAVCAGIPTLTVFNLVRKENWTPPGRAEHLAIQAEEEGEDRVLAALNQLLNLCEKDAR